MIWSKVLWSRGGSFDAANIVGNSRVCIVVKVLLNILLFVLFNISLLSISLLNISLLRMLLSEKTSELSYIAGEGMEVLEGMKSSSIMLYECRFILAINLSQLLSFYLLSQPFTNFLNLRNISYPFIIIIFILKIVLRDLKSRIIKI